MKAILSSGGDITYCKKLYHLLYYSRCAEQLTANKKMWEKERLRVDFQTEKKKHPRLPKHTSTAHDISIWNLDGGSEDALGDGYCSWCTDVKKEANWE